MPLTKEEQKRFEAMVRKECSPNQTSRKQFIAKVADFLFNLTGDVNWRMSVFSRYED